MIVTNDNKIFSGCDYLYGYCKVTVLYLDSNRMIGGLQSFSALTCLPVSSKYVFQVDFHLCKSIKLLPDCIIIYSFSQLAVIHR